MKIDLKKAKKIAVEAVSLSAEKLKHEFIKFDRQQIMLKSKNEVLTKHDLWSEKTIIKEIKKHFPDHHILSEEQGDNNKKSDYLWVIDPIDGTTNFSIHNPLWSIALALLYKQEVILGVIIVPMLNELFIAEKNKGAFLNGRRIIIPKNNDNKKIIHTFCHGSSKSDIQKAIKYYAYQKNNSIDCRQLGSAAIELAYVASGRIDSIVIPGAKPWDVLAGVLLVREAGGVVTNFDNKKWSLKDSTIVASNKKVLPEIMKVIKKLKL